MNSNFLISSKGWGASQLSENLKIAKREYYGVKQVVYFRQHFAGIDIILINLLTLSNIKFYS